VILSENQYFAFQRTAEIDGKLGLCTLLNKCHWQLLGSPGYVEGGCVRIFEPEAEGTFNAMIGAYQWEPSEWKLVIGECQWWAAGARLADESFPRTTFPAHGFQPEIQTWVPYQVASGKGRKPDIDRKFSIWIGCMEARASGVLSDEFCAEASLVAFLEKKFPELNAKVGTLRGELHRMGITSLQK